MRIGKRLIQENSTPSAARQRKALIRVLNVVAIAGLVLLTGCTHPAYFLDSVGSKEVRIRDDNILGQWILPEEPGVSLEVRAGRRGSYTFTMHDEEESMVATVTGVLFFLEGRTYVDAVLTDITIDNVRYLVELPETVRMHTLSLHVVGRIYIGTRSLTVEWLDGEWVEDYLDDHPEAMEFLYTSHTLVITSGKETIQAFLADHGGEWATRDDEPWVFKRPEPKPESQPQSQSQ
jgi:hypothetical protein